MGCLNCRDTSAVGNLGCGATSVVGKSSVMEEWPQSETSLVGEPPLGSLCHGGSLHGGETSMGGASLPGTTPTCVRVLTRAYVCMRACACSHVFGHVCKLARRLACSIAPYMHVRVHI